MYLFPTAQEHISCCLRRACQMSLWALSKTHVYYSLCLACKHSLTVRTVWKWVTFIITEAWPRGFTGTKYTTGITKPLKTHLRSSHCFYGKNRGTRSSCTAFVSSWLFKLISVNKWTNLQLPKKAEGEVLKQNSEDTFPALAWSWMGGGVNTDTS